VVVLPPVLVSVRVHFESEDGDGVPVGTGAGLFGVRVPLMTVEKLRFGYSSVAMT